MNSVNSKVNKIKRTKEQLKSLLVEQISALQASADGFDAGEKWEAKRIASVVYVLFRDGRRDTKSLTQNLGIQGSMPIFCSGPVNGIGNTIPFTPLIFIKMTDEGVTAEPLGDICLLPEMHRFVSFPEWWNEVIYRADGLEMSRKDLVLTMRDQDGGGHVDESIEATYAQFAESVSPQLSVQTSEGSKPLPDGTLATMRQIGYEVLATVKHAAVSELLLRANGIVGV